MTVKESQLSILISSRIRLTEEERKTLKTAYNNLSHSQQPDQLQEQGTSGIRTISAPVSTNIDRQVGMSRLVFMDLVNARDSISVVMVLKLQEALGVTIVDKKRMMRVCKEYVDYIFSN